MITTLVLATQIVVWHAYRGEEERGIQECARRFHELRPEITVEPVAIPYDAYTFKLESAIPHGNGPDLFVGKQDNLGQFVRAGLIEPVGELPASEFLDGALEAQRVDGKTYGIPFVAKWLALFWRRDKLPHPPSDTDELREQARGEQLAYEAGDFFFHAPWLHGFGGRILDEKNRPALDSREAAASVEFVLGLQRDRLLPEETSATLATQLFNEGRVAMTISGPWFIGSIARGVDFGVAPLPTVSATGRRPLPLLNIESLMLPARSKQPAAALEFARWLAGPEASKLRALKGRQTVASRAAWDDPEVARDPILGAFRAQLGATVPMSNAAEMRAVWEPANKALRRVLRGAEDPATSLKRAQREIEDDLRPGPPAAREFPYYMIAAVALLVAVVAFARSVRRPSASDNWAWGYLAPAAIAMVLLVFVPFFVGAGMSLFHYQGIAAERFVGLANFLSILGSREFYATAGVTALWTIANVLLHVAIGVALALFLRDPALKLRGVYRVLLIVPWAVPNYITAIIWKGMFHRQFGAINGLLALAGVEPISWFSRFSTAFCANLATNVWLGFPFFMVVTLGALSRIPKELEEAAALDGATRGQRLYHVILPLLRPALLPSVLLGVVWTFNMFNVIYLVSGGEPDGATEILVSQAYDWAFTRGHRYGYAAAYAVLIFALLALQSWFSRRATEVEAS